MLHHDVLRKLYNANNDEELLRRLSIKNQYGSYFFKGKRFSSIVDAANYVHDNYPPGGDKLAEKVETQATDENSASPLEAVLWLYAGISFLGALSGLFLLPEEGQSEAARHADLILAISVIVAGLFQALIMAAISQALGYLRRIERNTQNLG